jgi:hypothetical protein
MRRALSRLRELRRLSERVRSLLCDRIAQKMPTA